MALDSKLFNQICDDLKKDFPKITSIKQDKNDVVIAAEDDVLWNIFEALFNGVENMEMNLDKNQEHCLIITF